VNKAAHQVQGAGSR